eukprot:UN21263
MIIIFNKQRIIWQKFERTVQNDLEDAVTPDFQSKQVGN